MESLHYQQISHLPMMCSVHFSMHGVVNGDVVPLNGTLHTRKALSMAIQSSACIATSLVVK